MRQNRPLPKSAQDETISDRFLEIFYMEIVIVAFRPYVNLSSFLNNDFFHYGRHFRRFMSHLSYENDMSQQMQLLKKRFRS